MPAARGGFSFGSSSAARESPAASAAPKARSLNVRTKSADVARARHARRAERRRRRRATSKLDRVDGGVNVKSASGDVERTRGRRRRQRPDRLRRHRARDRARAGQRRHASGDVTIGEAYDNVNANTVSGDQEHGAVMRGQLAAHSVSGDVRIGVRRGSKRLPRLQHRQRRHELGARADRRRRDRRRAARRDPGEDRQRRHQDHPRARANRRSAVTDRRCTHEPPFVGHNRASPPDRQAHDSAARAPEDAPRRARPS